MKHLEKYFNWKINFCLKEFFNMVMTVMTCFFTKIINENENVVWPVKGLASIKKIDLRHVSNEKGLPDMRIKKCRGSP